LLFGSGASSPRQHIGFGAALRQSALRIFAGEYHSVGAGIGDLLILTVDVVVEIGQSRSLLLDGCDTRLNIHDIA
jgi:hypothetical protein